MDNLEPGGDCRQTCAEWHAPDLIQLEPSVRIILEQSLDQIASALLDTRGESVLSVDNSSVGLVGLLTFERRTSLELLFDFNHITK